MILCLPTSGFCPTHSWITRGCFLEAGNILPLPNSEVQERLLRSDFTVERENCLRQREKEKKKPWEFVLSFELLEHLIQRGTVTFLFLAWRRFRTNACLPFAWISLKIWGPKGLPREHLLQILITKRSRGWGAKSTYLSLAPIPSPLSAPPFICSCQDKVKLGLRSPRVSVFTTMEARHLLAQWPKCHSLLWELSKMLW